MEKNTVCAVCLKQKRNEPLFAVSYRATFPRCRQLHEGRGKMRPIDSSERRRFYLVFSCISSAVVFKLSRHVLGQQRALARLVDSQLGQKNWQDREQQNMYSEEGASQQLFSSLCFIIHHATDDNPSGRMGSLYTFFYCLRLVFDLGQLLAMR